MKAAQASSAAAGAGPGEGEKRSINSELWHACAGPLVALPPAGSLVVYFPQGHSEQVAASMQKNGDGHVPNYPNLASKLICMLHNVTLHADPETDEVYAQMTLQPINTDNKDALLASSAYSPVQSRQQTEFFCKTLTASDTSTHGGFSVPRRSAEKIFPPLDFSMQPPVQELKAKDLHDNVWTFRHIYRGQPKRHLLTTGWSLFVSGKRLVAGDSVLFVRDEKSQLLLGIRRANKQPTSLPSSVLSSDSMHIGILAAAAHAAANSSPFTIFYNPRASPSEFVIPLAKYNKAIYSNHISSGMRFRMTFETEESGTRRYMGTITGINDLDPVRWKNSQWRNLQVAWDESAAGEKRNRVSIWEIEPVIAPFFICPTPFFSTKHPRQQGTLDDESADMENLFKRVRPWLGEDVSIRDSQSQNAVNPGLSLVQWMNMQRNPLLTSPSLQQDYLRSISGPNSQNIGAAELSRKLGLQMQMMQQNTIQFNAQKPPLQAQQLDQISNMSVPSIEVATTATQQQQLHDMSLQHRQHLLSQTNPMNQSQNLLTQSQIPISYQVQQQQKQPPFVQTLNPLHANNLQNQPPQLPFQHYQQVMQQQIQSKMQIQTSQQTDQHSQFLGEQFQLHTVQPQPQPQLQQLQPQLQSQQQFILPQSMLRQTQQFEQQNVLPEASGNLSNTNSFPQQNPSLQQVAQNTSAGTLFSQSWQQQAQQKPQQQQAKGIDLPGVFVPKAPANLLSPYGGCLTTNGAAQSVITDDAPSCSTSPSTNNGNGFPQTITSKTNCGSVPVDQVSHAAVGMVNSGKHSFRAQTASPYIIRESQQYESQVKPSVTISKTKNLDVVACRTYPVSAAQIDYFDSTSSVTSSHRSQNDGQLQSNFALSTFNESTMFIGDNTQGEVQASDQFGINIGCQSGLLVAKDSLLNKDINLRKDNSSDLPSFNTTTNYNAKESQQEPSSSYVSQSFGLPDNTFNSIDTTINDSSLLNKGSWAPAPQLQRTRTYTKVYKRGAVGRSIDITRYSGYDELKQDLARMFSLGRQVEDLQRMGWKLVFVDHENDVLLVGDDPWEEFVNNVRCIKILSPQEVQLIDGLGNNSLPNQACSSSEDGNAWRGPVDQITVNPSTLTYDHFG